VLVFQSGGWPVTGLVDCLWMCSARRADGPLMHTTMDHGQRHETGLMLRAPGSRTRSLRMTTGRQQEGDGAARVAWGRTASQQASKPASQPASQPSWGHETDDGRAGHDQEMHCGSCRCEESNYMATTDGKASFPHLDKTSGKSGCCALEAILCTLLALPQHF
jgi:hypothetical protein